MNARSPIQLSLPDAAATFKLGYQWGRSLPPLSVLLLYGDLGAGKTTLIQGIGAGLGITAPIVSPTFTLVNEYREGRLPLYHLDLYRLEASEVPGIEPEFYWEGREVDPGITAIEWAQRLPYLPDDYLEIHLSQPVEGMRSLQVKAFGDGSLAQLG
ncbi:MAG: tRNA (adenosine(37)-N6)-threonylcarbamoyltransferase complex ATPase subunit type 1 TsaE [Jaaginema sp. PMC 1079.18]|nr:tRNA (adenosine(37)-N6)-threonylcarbamoyltransferase complex ATPase subunit type 1 TsaE [Jaaginema sp. PMC 1080.18]MEC4852368.1 tRNA (adenosine(37)-N6)-threonylcarbamoyltransferase complex ATPase subunit type 1 TsaE [Jaaginema sp. PMC 1079.18]MEC4866393.1 tRNA (adenosine(37)-N6)-threonylcarbamoyltransferase complex ATPase subunit type 1 TsaE [Jaaginema sp. PMC 1078.18]